MHTTASEKLGWKANTAPSPKVMIPASSCSCQAIFGEIPITMASLSI